MKIVKGNEMKEIDKRTIEKYGVASLKLMEAAGTCVYEEIIKELDGQDKRVTIICGKGNNGGDGYVIARKLIENNVLTQVYTIQDPKDLQDDTQYNYQRLLDLNIEVKNAFEDRNFSEDVRQSDVVVDAILGTGITRELDEKLKKIILEINQWNKKILAVDVPTGIGSDDGKVYGAALKASKTITMGFPKVGLILYPGAEYAGKVIVKDIGIDERAVEEMAIRTYVITEKMVRESIPVRNRDTHKGTYGKALIIAGSRGMAGAAVLSARAALRSGAGLVTIAVNESINDIIQISVPEAITLPFKEIEEKINNYSSIAIGPGIGRNKGLLYWIDNIVEKYEGPVILDADALNIIGPDAEPVFSKSKKIIITPHPGEMAKLTGLSIKEINENKIDIARTFSEKWDITIVLKGARTVIAFPNGEVYINTTGNPGMATGGSGDVLTGILASLSGQIDSIEKAVLAGVYIHGRAGDIMAEKVGQYGLTAGDITMGSALAIKELHDI